MATVRLYSDAALSVTTEISIPSTNDGVSSPEAPKHTHAQILKSTALIGGSSVINVGFGILRTKAMAIILGPSGVGLMGLYQSIADVTQSLAGMGIQSSGVRQ